MKRHMIKLKKAHSVTQEICTCGCGGVNVFLHDEHGREFACFTLNEDQWLPFAQDAVRLCHGLEPQGPDQTVVMQ